MAALTSQARRETQKLRLQVKNAQRETRDSRASSDLREADRLLSKAITDKDPEDAAEHMVAGYKKINDATERVDAELRREMSQAGKDADDDPEDDRKHWAWKAAGALGVIAAIGTGYWIGTLAGAGFGVALVAKIKGLLGMTIAKTAAVKTAAVATKKVVVTKVVAAKVAKGKAGAKAVIAKIKAAKPSALELYKSGKMSAEDFVRAMGKKYAPEMYKDGLTSKEFIKAMAEKYK